MVSNDAVLLEKRGAVLIVTINRPEVKNAVNPETARQLAKAFVTFDEDEELRVAVLQGSNGCFCAGADLKAVASGDAELSSFPKLDGDLAPLDERGPMGPSYLRLSKPVIAAVSGHAVAGGLELALWCDLRVAEEDAVFGVYCRRWGVPLVDGGTVRLGRLIGHSHAMDMILTGRPVDSHEAKAMGLANRVVPSGCALTEAVAMAEQIAKFPQQCMLNDRRSAYEQWDLSFEQAMTNENSLGRKTLMSGETVAGAGRFASGKGRGGSFDDI